MKLQSGSEYKEHFRPTQSFKSASFSPSLEQAAPWAGAKSSNIACQFEPPLQRKKRVDGPPVSYSTDFYDKTDAAANEYALLGQQEKFASNVKYKPRGGVSSFRDASPPKQQKLDRIKEKLKEKPKPTLAPVVNTEAFTSLPTPLAPRRPKGEEAPIVKEALKDKNLSDMLDIQTKKVNNMNESVQTNMEKGVTDCAPEAPADYALKFKAGVAPPRPSRKQSEYQREFDWKKGVSSSPMLAAEQVVYNSKIGPVKAISMPKTTEYKAQFKPWKMVDVEPKNQEIAEQPKKKRAKIKRSKSVGAPNSRPAAGSSPVVTSDNHRLIKETEQKPAEIPKPQPFHGKMRKFKTEYQSNFKSPVRYSYEKGAWKGADPPQLFSQTNGESGGRDQPLANWFAEVIELRRRAEEYKKRAQGTHFSREHLVQLLAKQANYWDIPTDRSSTLSALSLESGVSPLAQEVRRQNQSQKRADEKSHEKNINRVDFDSCKATIADSPSPSEFEDLDVSEEKLQPAIPKGRAATKKMAWTEDSEEVEDGFQDKFADEDASTVVPDDEDLNEGRLPTPVLRQTNESVRKTRHHLDLTTPAVGGAILTSPPHPKTKCASGQSEDSWDDDLEMKQLGRTYNLRKLLTTPTFGQPSPDAHALRDDEASTDRPLKTQYVSSPVKEVQESESQKESIPSIHNPKKKHKQRLAGIPSTINEQMGLTYNKPVPDFKLGPDIDEDREDALSVSVRSIASSCSLASDLYERSKNRRDNFWSKGNEAVR